MSIFLIAYVDDCRGKMEYWVRASAVEIYDVLSSPTMSWLMEKNFYVMKAVIGKKNGTKTYVSRSRGDDEYKPSRKLLRKMEKEFNPEENIDEGNMGKLYKCSPCNTFYLKRAKCKHCGRKTEKIQL